MALSREKAAELLGMKVEEIRNVEVRNGETLVTTHDGVVTTVDGDKLTTRMGDGDVVVAESTEDGPQVVSGGGPDGQASVVAQAMALPVDDDRADVRVVDEALFGAAEDEDLAELGLARRGGPVRADAPPHPIFDGGRNQREAEAGFGRAAQADAELSDELDEQELAKAIAGNAKDVLAWVGNDPVKAQRAIDAEKARTSTPRVTLLHALDQIAKAEQG